MRKIIGIGETVFDIIFKEGIPQAAKAGGAMLNSMVSLGRIGLPAFFVSEYGNDPVGNIIDGFLNENGVSTEFSYRFSDGKTKLAIAMLNERNDADYSFYDKYPSERLKVSLPVTGRNDIVLFGSIYAITDEIRNRFTSFIRSAYDGGGILIYDPNFRKTHSSELNILRPLIIENMQNSVLVRGSDEDFRNIFGAETPDEAWEAARHYCRNLVYTASGHGVYVRTEVFSGEFPVNQIIPVSTIGAGDNFNSGMIAALYKMGIGKEEIGMMGEEKWSAVISSGVGFATDVCLSYDNYISHEFAAKVRGSAKEHG
ncbi:MAG: carbohydrate kinase [Bacteroidales bacterium]|nr:carbohydrate kinase [Bacteroidales bacterium]